MGDWIIIIILQCAHQSLKHFHAVLTSPLQQLLRVQLAFEVKKCAPFRAATTGNDSCGVNDHVITIMRVPFILHARLTCGTSPLVRMNSGTPLPADTAARYAMHST